MTTITVETLRDNGWLQQNNAIGGVWCSADDGKRHDVNDPAPAL
jgi:hypothetical protein